MADPREWGPPMWKIYHTIAENLGKSKKELAQNDELYYFKTLQKKILTILPCKVCKNHYKEYSKNIKSVPYNEIKKYGKEYFLNLHNEINEEADKPIVKYEDLETMYRYTKGEILKSINTLIVLYQKYVIMKYVKPEDINEFIRMLHIFIHMLSI